MDNVACPSCSEKTGGMSERQSIESGLKVTFECDGCGHIWDVVF